MAIWELIPTVQESAYWRGSTYKGRVIVQAPTEREARAKAEEYFYPCSKSIPPGYKPITPWKDRALVTCRRMVDVEYEASGPTQILFPR